MGSNGEYSDEGNKPFLRARHWSTFRQMFSAALGRPRAKGG
jgi:hypothetical protein